MMYANYTYYKEYLHGKEAVIKETEFDYYESQARAIIKEQTLGNSELNIIEEVKDCTCALAESLCMETNEKAQNNPTIASEKVGEYSVSYRTNDSISANYEADRKKIIVRYLGLTGLLYRGA